MIEDLIKHYSIPEEQFPKEVFSDWKSHPVTVQLFRDFAIAYMDHKVEETPMDFCITDNLLKREGTTVTITQLFEWDPSEEGEENES